MKECHVLKEEEAWRTRGKERCKEKEKSSKTTNTTTTKEEQNTIQETSHKETIY